MTRTPSPAEPQGTVKPNQAGVALLEQALPEGSKISFYDNHDYIKVHIDGVLLNLQIEWMPSSGHFLAHAFGHKSDPNASLDVRQFVAQIPLWAKIQRQAGQFAVDAYQRLHRVY